MKALLVAPGNMPGQILTGEKKITIRKGYREFEVGETIMIGCHIANWAVLADITSVEHVALEDVEVADYRDDGFKTYDSLVLGMQKFYPELQEDDIVTVIKWDNVRGGILGNV